MRRCFSGFSYLFLSKRHGTRENGYLPTTHWGKIIVKNVRRAHFYFPGRSCYVLTDLAGVRSVWWSDAQLCTVHISCRRQRRGGGRDVWLGTPRKKLLQNQALAVVYIQPSCPRNTCIGKRSKFSLQVSLKKKNATRVGKNFLDSFHLPCMWMCMCMFVGRVGKGGDGSPFNL